MINTFLENFVGLLFVLVMMILFWKLNRDQKLLEKVIKFQNDIKGVQTKITPTTIKWMKIRLNWGLVVGILIILVILFEF